MVNILLASRNPGKWVEFSQIFAAHNAAFTLLEPRDDAPYVAETGRSYRANARLKAVAYSVQYNTPALGDDSGLVVAALGGAPGLYTARFGGEGLSADERMALLLERMRGVPPQERGAHFICALYLAFPDGRAVTAQGIVRGRIAEEGRGGGGFGYDPIFYLPHRGCTMAELPPPEKHRLSHRGRAAAHLLRQMVTLPT